jgi:DoxX-like family
VNSTKSLWAGRIVTAILLLFLLFDGITKVMKVARVLQAQAQLGYSESTTAGIGVLLLACTIVWIIPRTSVLGAILLTGYLGGATASQVRIGAGGSVAFPIVFAVLMWGALYLCDDRLRALIPVRQRT